MRTIIELPDELLRASKGSGAFLESVQQKLLPQINGPRMGVLTPEQLEDAMFGPLPE